LLPIETKVREFQGKVLLSCFAAEAGFRVVIANQNEMHRYLNSLPRGIYIDKSIVRSKIPSFQKNRRIGNRVVAWCEEGLSFRVPNIYLRENISLETYNLAEHFFAWGEFEEKTIRQKIQDKDGKIVCAGNPRFDLLRHPFREIFSPEAERLRERFGPFILINTNFSRYNHFNGPDFFINKLKKAGRIQDAEHEAFLVRWRDYLGEMYHHFVKMTRHLSKAFPKYRIIIRPHPSESQERWRDETKDLQNVEVIHEGNVISWIMASKVMIHNSCTTGVEAYVLDEPVVCYCPIRSETFDSRLPNGISSKAFSPDELIVLIKRVLEDSARYVREEHENPKASTLIAEYIMSVKGPTACENIVTALSRMVERDPQLKNQTSVSPSEKIKRRLDVYAMSTKRMINRLRRSATGGEAYLKQKFPGLMLEEIEQMIEAFRQVTGRFQGVEARPYPGAPPCFLISQKKE
jgi:surface carbohydrate biosynthesis protein